MELNKLNPNILLVTASFGEKGDSGILAYDFFKAFKTNGFDIELFTEYKADIIDEHLYLKKKRSKNYTAIIKALYNKYILKNNDVYSFFYRNEHRPPVNPSHILSKINKKYDLVIILFWNKFIGAQVIEKIYDKLKCPIYFFAVDDSPVTAGCHYVYNCTGYQKMCEDCPSLFARKYTFKNMQYRLNVWNKVKPKVFTNTFCSEYFKKSTLFKGETINIIYPVINEKLFKPTTDKTRLRKKYGINDDNIFVMFFGASYLNNQRKGLTYLYESLRKFHNQIDASIENNIIVLIAGNNDQILDNEIPFIFKKLGVLDMQNLAEVFAISDLYLSPSVMDAGPMMVNQSLSCGTPVVCFEIGVAMDVINGKGTGYCAKLKDTDDFARGIKTIYNLNETERKNMTDRCRKMALETTSYNAVINKIMNVYKSI